MYREIESPLYNFALRWVFDAALAEEVMHDAFVRVWNKRDEVEVSTLKGLLYKTVQNLALNEIRRRKVSRAFKDALQTVNWFSDDESPGMEADFIQQQDFKQMRAALETLPHDLREVLLLSQFSDLNYEEIAAALEIPLGTVASRKSRALLLMREKMEDSDV
ncbi:MAG: RNA polymerase sigma factor [Bdellovibrionales bacterium]